MRGLSGAPRTVVVALVVCLADVAAASPGGSACRPDRGGFASDGEIPEQARKCVDGSADACRSLTWVPGVGRADLGEIPDDLAVSVEPVLSRLCAAGDEGACFSRGKILVRLGRTDQAIQLYAGMCSSSWPACLDAGRLELEEGRLDAALAHFGRVCETTHDGDRGVSCGCMGEILERRKRKREARKAYEAACARGDNDSCAAGWRLTGRSKSSGAWEGLYRSPSGTLLIEEKEGHRVAVRMETLWANGHTCGYDGVGTIVPATDRVLLDSADEKCRPFLTKKGRDVTLADPENQCRANYCGVRGMFEDTFTKTESATPASP